MTHLPADLKYAATHEWARLEGDNTIQVGITDFAQEQLGDLVFIEFPKVGRTLAVGEQCAVVESVKTASDLHSPVAGEVVAVNTELGNALEQVNDSPYAAWLFRIKTNDVSALDQLMTAEEYLQMINE